MAINLGTAYVDIVPSTSNLARELRGQVEQPLANTGRSAGTGFGNRFVDGITAFSGRINQAILSTVTGAATIAATGAAGILSMAFISGFSRFTALENADRMLTQLGLNTSQVETLMAALNDTLTGTAFSLDQGAGAMSRLVASSVPLEQVPGILDSIADAAAFGQTSLDEVGLIFSRIASQGRVTAMELNMLTDRNIPAFELLASAIGVTVEELRSMVSRGELDAQTFFAAWEEGAQGFGENNIRMAGAAQSMGDTTQGALANLRAAIGRFGANAFEPIFQAIAPLADSLRETFDRITPRVREFVDEFTRTDAFQGFLDFVADLPNKVGPAAETLSNLGDAVGPLAGLLVALGTAGLRGLPLLGWIPKLNPLVGIFAGLVAQSPELREALIRLWEAFQPLVETIGGALIKAFQSLEPIMVTVFDFLAKNPGPTLAAVAIGGLTWAVGILATALMTLWANPITLVIGALALLAFGLVYAYQNSETFRTFVDKYLIPTLEIFGWIGKHLILPVLQGMALSFLAVAVAVYQAVEGIRALKAELTGFLFNGSFGSKVDQMVNDVRRARGAVSGAGAGASFGGKFHSGGVVPGRRGQEVNITAMAGETVLPTHNSSWVASLPATSSRVDLYLHGADTEMLRMIQKMIRVRGGNVQTVLGGAA